MPAIRACLEHRHAYVRRNAVLAIYTIYRYARDAHLTYYNVRVRGSVFEFTFYMYVC